MQAIANNSSFMSYHNSNGNISNSNVFSNKGRYNNNNNNNEDDDDNLPLPPPPPLPPGVGDHRNGFYQDHQMNNIPTPKFAQKYTLPVKGQSFHTSNMTEMPEYESLLILFANF